MTGNDRKMEIAIKAINQIYSDTSASRRTCVANLRVLREEIDILLDAIEGFGGFSETK